MVYLYQVKRYKYTQTSQSKGGNHMRTITINEIMEMESNTFSKKDNSVRGISTVSKDQLQIGDKVVLENYFTEIVE